MKNNKGVTLIELMTTLALLSIIILGGASLLRFSIFSQNKVVREFDIQSNLRSTSLKINTIVRDTSAVYLLHRENANNLTPEWNYIMLSPEKNRLINYVWNPITNSHEVVDFFPALEDVTLDLLFNKDSAPNEDNLMEFILTVSGSGEDRSVDGKLEAKNSLQIVDRSYLKDANVLAYRNDSRIDEVSNAQAVVSLVLDKSGSMANRMDGSSKVNDSGSDRTKFSRMKLMKEEAVRLVNELSELPNINISLNPFDSSANSSDSMRNAKSQLGVLKSNINNLNANGGTNTGDGIRRGFYRIKEFNDQIENMNKTNKNFMIVLVDGVTTFSSIHENITLHEIVSNSDLGSSTVRNGITYNFSHKEDIYIYIFPFGNIYLRTEYYYKTNPSIRYVTGNNNISVLQASNNVIYDDGRYFGNGLKLDPNGTDYVDLIGKMVREYKQGTNEAIKVYVIGFSGVTDDYGSLRDIALATTGDTIFYTAGSSEALEEIFRAIQRDISDALWHIGGPN